MSSSAAQPAAGVGHRGHGGDPLDHGDPDPVGPVARHRGRATQGSRSTRPAAAPGSTSISGGWPARPAAARSRRSAVWAAPATVTTRAENKLECSEAPAADRHGRDQRPPGPPPAGSRRRPRRRVTAAGAAGCAGRSAARPPAGRPPRAGPRASVLAGLTSVPAVVRRRLWSHPAPLSASAKPIRRTSVRSSTPNRSATVGAHVVDRARRRRRPSPPSSAWMKLACFSDTRAVPSRSPSGRPPRPAGRPSRPAGW